MKKNEQLLLENKAWAREMVENDPNFFLRHVKGQKPDFLWIGCSDSRVSPDTITQSQPGEAFIHRNVANLVVPTDLNLLSVLQYAVEVLEINHVIVCGHYECGGVKAAMSQTTHGLIDGWLQHVKDVYRFNRAEIDALPEDKRINRMIELNIREQLYNLAKTNIIQSAWKRHRRPHLHGWVYNLESGLIDPLLELTPESFLDEEIYVLKNA
ncbi:MAG: carbonic anhydrase [Micavibrio sp.]|nr:carbonic anhydrase [Micavibrio sp.]